eukprot:238568_1
MIYISITTINSNLANIIHIHAWLLICIKLLSLICIDCTILNGARNKGSAERLTIDSDNDVFEKYNIKHLPYGQLVLYEQVAMIIGKYNNPYNKSFQIDNYIVTHQLKIMKYRIFYNAYKLIDDEPDDMIYTIYPNIFEQTTIIETIVLII